MNSLPLLFPFEASQQTTITEPTNETLPGVATSTVTVIVQNHPPEAEIRMFL